MNCLSMSRRTVLLGTSRCGAIVLTGPVKTLLGTVVLLPLRCRLCPANGQIDLAVIQTDDHDLHILTFGQMVVNVVDVGMGDFRNMYHTGLIARQQNERAELGNGLYFTLNDRTNCKLHNVVLVLPLLNWA